MTKYLHLVLLVPLILLSACGPSRIAVQPEFWKMTDRVIGIAVTTSPRAFAHRIGSEGLLDMAINEAASGTLESHLQTLEADQFQAIIDTFSLRLEERGFKIKRIDRAIDIKSLPKLKTKPRNTTQTDFRSIKQEEGVDLLLLLQIESWGTARHYYGFIALESPKGMCAASGYLIELETNKIAWRTIMDIEDSCIEVTDPWDSPPDFPNVTTAVRSAIHSAIQYLENDFFEVKVE